MISIDIIYNVYALWSIHIFVIQLHNLKHNILFRNSSKYNK